MLANASKILQVAKFSKDSIHEVSKVLIGDEAEYCTCAIRGVSYLNQTIRSMYTIMVIV